MSLYKRNYNKSAFTLVELAVATFIASLIGLVVILVYRGNLFAYKWGKKKMEFHQKIQLTMKQLFTDIKKINPIVTIDSHYNLWFEGEKLGDLNTNLVKIVDKNGDLNDGGEEVSYIISNILNNNDSIFVRIFLDGDNLIREVKDSNGKVKQNIVATLVKSFHVKNNPDDIHEIVFEMTIHDDNDPNVKEDINFGIRLDTNLVCVKFM